jgi:hypothetical protein
MTDLFEVRPDLPQESGMVWEKVESSQISEIGYATGAEYPLGLRFPPNKKQKADGLPGSEYHYANVTPEMFAEFVAAESIGSYFIKNIKNRENLYPYVKVETENPPQPPSSPNGGGETSTIKSFQTSLSGTSTQNTKENSNETLSPSITTDGETTSHNTALAVIDSMADDLLFTPGAVTDAQLAAGRQWYLTEAKKYDVTTEKGRTELKRFARPLQKLRTGIEARAKELTGATKRKIAAIDAEKRRLVLLVGNIEDEVLAPSTAWEQEEEARKARLSQTVSELALWGQSYYRDIASIEKVIAELESFDLYNMQEFKVSAESAIAASLRVLKPELERRKEAEAQAAELAELRKKQAERDEADRKADEQRKIEGRIAEEAEKLAAKKVEAVDETVRLETRQEVIAELSVPTKPDWMEPTEPDGPGDDEPFEPQPTAYEPERIPTPIFDNIAAYRSKQKVHDEIVNAMVALQLDHSEARAVLNAIIDGRISHVKIEY